MLEFLYHITTVVPFMQISWDAGFYGLDQRAPLAAVPPPSSKKE